MPRFRAVPPRLPLDASCSDVPEHWPGGKLPTLRPRPMDPNAPPAPQRPDATPCPHEAELDRLTVAAAERLMPGRAWAPERFAGVRPAGLGVWHEHLAERLDAAAAVAGELQPAVRLAIVTCEPTSRSGRGDRQPAVRMRRPSPVQRRARPKN